MVIYEFTKILLSKTYRRPIGDPLQSDISDWRPISETDILDRRQTCLIGYRHGRIGDLSKTDKLDQARPLDLRWGMSSDGFPIIIIFSWTCYLSINRKKHHFEKPVKYKGLQFFRGPGRIEKFTGGVQIKSNFQHLICLTL